MTRKAIRIDPIIPLAAQSRNTSEISPAIVGGTRELVNACSTLESSARPGATDASQRATASRPLSGSRMSATETTNATSGTSEKSIRNEMAAASWEVAWRL